MKIDNARRKFIRFLGILPLALNFKVYGAQRQRALVGQDYVLVNWWILKQSDLVD